MKTINTHFQRIAQQQYFTGMAIIPFFTIFFTLLLCSCTGPYIVGQNPDMVKVAPPTWASEYDNDNPANYYYLPDIETYYDLRNREFVYLENGNWRFSASLPSIYASLDLNNCFVVKLNNAVHEPWMHFHYYVAHYPRYFYKSYDRDRSDYQDRPARWFNENLNHYGYDNDRGNKEFGNKNERRQEPRFSHEPNNNYNQRGTNNSTNSNNVRQRQDSRQDRPQRNEGSANKEQPMKYYGRQIGQPVKVQRNMMKPREEKRQPKSQEKKGRDR